MFPGNKEIIDKSTLLRALLSISLMCLLYVSLLPAQDLLKVKVKFDRLFIPFKVCNM